MGTDAKIREKKEAAGDEEDEDDDGPASRLVSQLLAFLLKGFQSKSKIARFRCVQLVALMVNSLGEIECVPILPVLLFARVADSEHSDDSYRHLKGALLERVRDKESTVRMQAVVALSKLQSADDDEESDDDDDEGEATRVSEVLIDVLTHDSAAFVPPLLPSALANPPPTEQRSPPRSPLQPPCLPQHASRPPPPHSRRRSHQPARGVHARLVRDPVPAPLAGTAGTGYWEGTKGQGGWG